jgi:hypothetical protein
MFGLTFKLFFCFNSGRVRKSKTVILLEGFWMFNASPVQTKIVVTVPKGRFGNQSIALTEKTRKRLREWAQEQPLKIEFYGLFQQRERDMAHLNLLFAKLNGQNVSGLVPRYTEEMCQTWLTNQALQSVTLMKMLRPNDAQVLIETDALKDLQKLLNRPVPNPNESDRR